MGLLKEKAALEAMFRNAGQEVEPWITLAEQTFEFVCTARKRFAQGNTKTRKEIFSTVASNLRLKDRKLWIEARKLFYLLEKSLVGAALENKAIEPEKISLVQGRNGANACYSPTWGARIPDRTKGFRPHCRERFSASGGCRCAAGTPHSFLLSVNDIAVLCPFLFTQFMRVFVRPNF